MKFIPRILVLIALLVSVGLIREFMANRQLAGDLERSVVMAQAQSRPPLLSVPDGLPPPPPPPKGSHQESDNSVEIAALGAQLKLVNEASWGMIFKFCFLWFFTLATVLAFRIIDRRYS